MALDTRDKRLSALGRSLPFLTVYPIPDGTIDAGDRLQLAWLYRGFADTPPEPVEITPVPERTFYVLAQNRTFTVRWQNRTFKVKR